MVNVTDSNVSCAQLALNFPSCRPPNGLFLSKYEHVELKLWIGVTVAISFFGALLNLATLTVTFWKRTAESIFNLLMSHYVAISLFICLINMPIHAFMVLAKLNGHSIPPGTCQVVQFFFTFCFAACNWADVCLAINRFVAIVFPLSYRWWTSKWVNIVMVTFVWLLCMAAVLPLSLGIGGSMPMLMMGQCGFLPVGRWAQLILSITAYIPYALIAGLSLAIWIKILAQQRGNNRVRVVDGTHAVRSMVISRRRLVIARMLLMTTVWSTLCNIPWAVIQCNFLGLYRTEPVSILWLRTVQVLQLGLTPVILYTTNEDYQKRFAVLLVRLGATRQMLMENPVGTKRADASTNVAGMVLGLPDQD